ncbi:MAG: ABC transporter ATP-binding protein [Promethearchaeota archaeon]|nr:MAG: ABC transporter ATP-binding protein [Candidatus Lokiarchaeota archaeon]
MSSIIKVPQLEVLRLKIVDAIRFSEKYWMIYRERTFGIATILDLIYKRLYIEILFFTNEDVIKRGVPLIKIYTPTETEFDFIEIIVEPDIDKDGLVSPKKIIERVNKLIKKELESHLAILDNEIQLIDEHFENSPVVGNPYFRKIRIYLPDLIIKFKINLEKYPLEPKLMEKNQIIIEKYIKTYIERFKEILREKFKGTLRQKVKRVTAFMENISINTDVIKSWDAENPPHIFQIIKSLFNLKGGTQHLVVNNISSGEDIKDITFNIHRGQSIGILYNLESSREFRSNTQIVKLFNIIAGSQLIDSGTIKLFGRHIQLATNDELKKIVITSHLLDERILNMSIKKAVHYNIKIKPKWKIRKRALSTKAKFAGIFSKIDEIISLPPKYKTKKSFINSALEVTGLLNRKKEKVSTLSNIDRLLLSISRELLKSPDIIMFSVPPGELERIQGENFNDFMNKIKKKFHVILIIHGRKNIVSNCDKILMVSGKTAELGTVNDFISKIPHFGEIITIELNNPDIDALKKMLEIKSATFITERVNEKYKIFSRKNPDQLIIKLMEIVGPYIYNYKKYKASMHEYLEFFNLT